MTSFSVQLHAILLTPLQELLILYMPETSDQSRSSADVHKAKLQREHARTMLKSPHTGAKATPGLIPSNFMLKDLLVSNSI